MIYDMKVLYMKCLVSKEIKELYTMKVLNQGLKKEYELNLALRSICKYVNVCAT